MKTKLLTIGGGVLLSILIGWVISLKSDLSQERKLNTELNEEIDRLVEERKAEVKIMRDSAQLAVAKEAAKGKKRFDSILNLPPTIIYRPYVKEVYPNRDLNTALRVHSEHKQDSSNR
jgi:uncharacterized membrane protein